MFSILNSLKLYFKTHHWYQQSFLDVFFIDLLHLFMYGSCLLLAMEDNHKVVKKTHHQYWNKHCLPVSVIL